jgi:hypothetical protein
MRLRARVKAIEEIPDAALCCVTMSAQLQTWAASGRTVEVLTGRRGQPRTGCHCMACGAKYTGVPMAGMKGWYLDPRAWDIEEAPIESEAAHA